MKPRILRETHQASYADPIKLSKGVPLSLTGREDLWDGHRWLWAIAQDGRQGWVPDDLITEGRAGPVAAGDYSALELSCPAEEAVEIIWQTHGWAWCQKTDGSEGWLPLRILSEA